MNQTALGRGGLLECEGSASSGRDFKAPTALPYTLASSLKNGSRAVGLLLKQKMSATEGNSEISEMNSFVNKERCLALFKTYTA